VCAGFAAWRFRSKPDRAECPCGISEGMNSKIEIHAEQAVAEVSGAGKNGDRHEISRSPVSAFVGFACAKIRACHHICRTGHFYHRLLARELATSHLPFPAWLALVIVMAIVIAVIASTGH